MQDEVSHGPSGLDRPFCRHHVLEFEEVRLERLWIEAMSQENVASVNRGRHRRS
jgi:hypothetical protein